MIIPSIDIMNSKAVQLKQGRTKVLEEKNLQKLVKKFRFFPETNVIDLDAAMSKRNNKELIKKLCRQLPCNVGGGIRSKEVAYEYLRAGAKNIIIGTNATPEFLKKLPKHRTIVALDVKKGKIAVNGWKKITTARLNKKIKELERFCSGFLITNIDVEGLNKGSDLKFIRSIQNLTKNRVIVAGGISSYEEIQQINKLGFDQVLGMSTYTGKVQLDKALLSVLDFSKDLVPTIAQDMDGNVLMLAYSSKESVLKTLKTGYATYYSRSRKMLWTKGLASGNTQNLVSVRYDCDADALIFTVEQKGVACHTGRYSCFAEKGFSLNYLLEFLKKRLAQGGEDSYTVKICRKEEKLHKKIIEEAFEVTQAKNRDEQVWEIADLLYFISVYMAKHNITHQEIVNELSLRHK